MLNTITFVINKISNSIVRAIVTACKRLSDLAISIARLLLSIAKVVLVFIFFLIICFIGDELRLHDYYVIGYSLISIGVACLLLIIVMSVAEFRRNSNFEDEKHTDIIILFVTIADLIAIVIMLNATFNSHYYFRSDMLRYVQKLCETMVDRDYSKEYQYDSQTHRVAMQKNSESSDWAVGFDCAGPVRIGMSIEQLSKALNITIQLPAALFERNCFYVESEHVPGVSFMISESTLARIDVTSSRHCTKSGVHIGDNEQKVRSVYGKNVVTTPHNYTDGHYLTVSSPVGEFALRFETENGVVTKFYAGRFPEVIFIEGCL